MAYKVHLTLVWIQCVVELRQRVRQLIRRSLRQLLRVVQEMIFKFRYKNLAIQREFFRFLLFFTQTARQQKS